MKAQNMSGTGCSIEFTELKLGIDRMMVYLSYGEDRSITIEECLVKNRVLGEEIAPEIIRAVNNEKIPVPKDQTILLGRRVVFTGDEVWSGSPKGRYVKSEFGEIVSVYHDRTCPHDIVYSVCLADGLIIEACAKHFILCPVGSGKE